MKNLALKSFLGMVNLAVMMGLMLFLPARTTGYPQAWVYLALFFTGVSVITVYIYLYDKPLLLSRIRVGTVAEKRISQKIIQSFASLGFIGMYVISGLDYRYGWSGVSPEIGMIADGVVVLSLVLMFRVFRKNSFLSAIIEVQGNQQVITDGPYRIVRHPMYSAALLLFAASPPALGSCWALLTFPLMTVVLALRCLDEEKMLKEQLSGYSDYCRKTRYRLIPVVW
jgi:protein-S-isoprenylcysteine O-methyltransferase Ste14